MAKIKSNHRTTQVKLTKNDSAFILNNGVGVHMLLSERLGGIVNAASSSGTLPENIAPEDYVFIKMLFAYMEAAEETGGNLDTRPPEAFS
jgi:hypothetical protein